MTAPPQAGSYRTYWRLQDGSGNFLPVFYSGKNITHFYVDIKVAGDANSGGASETATASYSLEQGSSGTICTTNAVYLVSVNVTTDSAASVDYRFDLTDSSGQVTNGVFTLNGSPEVKDTLTFTAAGTQQLLLEVTGPYAYPKDLVVQVYLDDTTAASAAVTCP
jgi:hypothetical protein